jgi:hypothetical protein
MPLTQVNSGLLESGAALANIGSGNITPAYLNTQAQYTGFKNRIINGAFNIFQRTTVNTSVAITGAFTYQTADRWALAMAATVAGSSAVINTSMPTGFSNALRIGRNSSSTSTGLIYFNQVVETANSIDLQGQPVTISFWARAGANFSSSGNLMFITLNTGTGVDSTSLSATFGSWTGNAQPLNTSQAITTTWTRYSFTCTLASNITQIGALFAYAPTGTAGADDNLYVTGVQLEKGSTATSFDYRPYGTELMLCQRYYVQDPVVGIDAYQTAGAAVVKQYYFPVTMRISPTSTTTQTGAVVTSLNTAATTFSIDAGTSSTNQINLFIAATAAGRAYLYRPMQFSAEL